MDALTGLRDRPEFLDSLQSELQQYNGDNAALAVLVININRFRSINTVHGYRTADKILAKTARRLQSIIREQDIAGRIGADEFALILPRLKSPYFSELAANKIVTTLEEPFDIDGQSFGIKVNIGIALAAEHHSIAEALVQQADSALCLSRKMQQQYQTAQNTEEYQPVARVILGHELEQAISENELELYYQPKVNLVTQKLSGVEALVRWKHPEKGLIMPDRFIQVAEENSLILPLTLWTLNAALRQSAAICKRHRNFLVAVNLSASILDKDIVDLVMGVIHTWDVPPHQLTLEVTENTIMEQPDSCLRTLEQFRANNIVLSIDDFGTGHSSFSYLKRLPVQELKLDQSFVRDMNSSSEDANIVQAMIDLGRTFNLKVIAEGIEDWETLDRLTAMGCDYGQGYYIARPMPFDELLEWIECSGWGESGTPALEGGHRHARIR